MEINKNVFFLLIINLNFIWGNNDWSGEKWIHKDFLLKWKTNEIKKLLTTRLEVKTKGWVSFGFSKHGKTTEADMAIGWVDDKGNPVLNDFWVNDLGSRLLDQSQDWHLLSGVENSTHTVFELERNYRTCDQDDLEIYENEYEMSNIVFAYSLLDPQSIETIGDPHLESVIHLNLFNDENQFEPQESDLVQFNYWMNFTLPPKENATSLCQLMKNSAQDEHMVVKFKSEIYPANDATNHHFTLNNCQETKDLDIAFMDSHVGLTFPCYDSLGYHKYLREKCSKILLTSAVESTDALSFPNNAGIIIDPDKHPFIMMEGHIISEYHNPINISVVMRTWITRQFREHQTEYLPFGAASGLTVDNWGFILPPNVPAFKIAAVLDSYCLEKDLLENGIYIFANVYHSHHAQYMEIRHYRNDLMLRSLRYNHYDPNYQPYRPVRPHINFRRGDKFVLICEFKTINNSKSYTTPREHCISLNYYYPKTNLKSADAFTYSKMTYRTMLKVTGLSRIENFNQTLNQMIIREPAQYNNTKLINFVNDNLYKLKDPLELEELLISEDSAECCSRETLLLCQKIRPPPDLYESIKDRRLQNCLNTSPAEAIREQKDARSFSQPNSQRIEKFKGLKFSLKYFVNQFNLFFKFTMS